LKPSEVKEKAVGRPQALTKEELVDAIRSYATSSPTELARHLNVNRVTVHRRMKEIPKETINRIFEELGEVDLKPYQMKYEVFLAIPEVKEYIEKLEIFRRVSHTYKTKTVRSLWRICCHLKRHPRNLSLQECSKLVYEIEKGKIKLGLFTSKKAIRSWFENKGISGELLSSLGITGSAPPKAGSRAKARLTEQHRREFMQVLNRKVKENFKGKLGNFVISIPFKDKPDLALRMKTLPKFLYYTGTRKQATLNALWQNVEWSNPITFIKVVDKGNITWRKRISGDFLTEFKALHEALDKPQKGRIFPFSANEVTCFFRAIYKETTIPRYLWDGMAVHIWRHTAFQDMLDSNHRNFEVTCKLLGSLSVDTARKFYGDVGDTELNKYYLQSIGIKIQWTKREFKF